MTHYITVTSNHLDHSIDRRISTSELLAFNSLTVSEAIGELIEENELTLNKHCNRPYVTMQDV